MASAPTTGHVIKLARANGYGFIRASAGGEELFFHRSSCHDYEGLKEGDLVTYVPGVGPKGPRAENVSAA